MKFTASRPALLAAFSTASTVANQNKARPILSNVKLIAGHSGTLTLMGYDGEIGIRSTVDAVRVERPGVCVLPADKLGGIIRDAAADEVEIMEIARGQIRITAGRGKHNLSTPASDEFPDVAEFSAKQYHTIHSVVLGDLLKRTAFATDEATTRYSLNGILLEFGGDCMIGVATDGRRLAMHRGKAEVIGGHKPAEYGQQILPQRLIQVIGKMLADEDGPACVFANENSISVHGVRCTVTGQLVQGRFPLWRDVLKKNQKGDMHQTSFPAGDFLSAIKQCSVSTEQESKGVTLSFREGMLTIAARSQGGDSVVEFPLPYTGRDCDLLVNPIYVAEFLKAIDGAEVVTMYVKDGETSAILQISDGYTYVVMPMAQA